MPRSDQVAPELVEDPQRLATVLQALAGEDRYGIDTEFHLERTYHPRLALVQVAWADRVALLDPLAVDISPLGEVLRGPGTAVVHAADQDLTVLDAACGAVPSSLFDTQVAAGFLGMSTPSLSRLTERMLRVTLPKSDRLTDWVARPLTAKQLTYAAGDVAHLLALHDVMVERLRALGRLDWALDECSQVLSAPRRPAVPEEAWWRIRDHRQLRGPARGVAQEVAAWRERRAAELDLPRRSVLSDLALSAIVHRAPRSRAELQAVRGVEARHLANGAASEILAAVARGQALPADELRLPPEVREERAEPAFVAVASGLVRQIADEQRFDTSLLATRADLSDLLNGVTGRLDHGWRRQLVGDPVRRLLSGEVALAVQPGRGLVLEQRSGVPASLGAEPGAGAEDGADAVGAVAAGAVADAATRSDAVAGAATRSDAVVGVPAGEAVGGTGA